MKSISWQGVKEWSTTWAMDRSIGLERQINFEMIHPSRSSIAVERCNITKHVHICRESLKLFPPMLLELSHPTR